MSHSTTTNTQREWAAYVRAHPHWNNRAYNMSMFAAGQHVPDFSGSGGDIPTQALTTESTRERRRVVLATAAVAEARAAEARAAEALQRARERRQRAEAELRRLAETHSSTANSHRSRSRSRSRSRNRSRGGGSQA